jgi:tRNA U38,U39,U40 pseudouridine synthase TruA
MHKIVETESVSAVNDSKRSIWQRFLSLFHRKSVEGGSEKLKNALSSTLRRSRSVKAGNENLVNTVAMLRNSLSLKRNHTKTYRDVLEQDILEQKELNTGSEFEPIQIYPPTSTALEKLRNYRLSDSQFTEIRVILSLFNGTHNWHNYIPNALNEDPRNFMRLFRVDVAEPEMHEGMQWVRIKMTACKFARYQIRHMMGSNVLLIKGMLIQVVRTHTPPSIISHSFSIPEISIAIAPPTLILGNYVLNIDEPHYNSFNEDAIHNHQTPVNFGESSKLASQFLNASIYSDIYKTEKHEMAFEKWLRELDSYSFLCIIFIIGRYALFERSWCYFGSKK